VCTTTIVWTMIIRSRIVPVDHKASDCKHKFPGKKCASGRNFSNLP
jgi:hypothetical protein